MNQNSFGNLQNKPPVPSPHGELQTPQTSSRGLLAYVPMVAIGIGVFAVSMVISFVVNILFVGLAIIAIYVMLASIATEKLKALGVKLRYTIRSREGLQQVASIIDLNMKLAFMLTVILFPLIAVAVLKSAFIWPFLIMQAGFLIPRIMNAEKKFKAMQADAFDIEIAPEFAAILVRWKEPGSG